MKFTPLPGVEFTSPDLRFLLRKVFKVPYDSIEDQTGLVRFLLSKHYQGRRYPETLQQYLVERLEVFPRYGVCR